MEQGSEEATITNFFLKYEREGMELSGYTRIPFGGPVEGDMEKLERHLPHFQKSGKSATPSFDYCKEGEEGFLMSDPEVKRLIEARFKTEIENLIMQGPSIVEFKADPEWHSHFMTAHPIHTREAISLFSPLTGDAGWDNGLFAICTGSHHQSIEQFQNQSERDIHQIGVEKGWVLIVEGAAFVQPSPKGGIKMLWVGFSTHPMGGYIRSPYGFPFMKV